MDAKADINLLENDNILNCQIKTNKFPLKKYIILGLLFLVFIVLVFPHFRKTPDLPNQNVILHDIDGNDFVENTSIFGNIVQVELFILMETGGGGSRSKDYMYWDSEKFVYHRNRLLSTISNTHPSDNIECNISSSILDEINNEFIRTYSSNYPEDIISTLYPYGRVYLFTFVDGSEIVIYKISRSIYDQFSGMYKRETDEKFASSYDSILKEIREMINDSKVTPFEGGSLIELLYDLSMKKGDYDNNTNCRNLDIEGYENKVIYSP